jgi:hypothetical protein
MFKKGNQINKGRIPWNKDKKGLQKHTEEWKQKARERMIGNKITLGYKHTEEWKNNASKRLLLHHHLRGKPMSEEVKRKISNTKLKGGERKCKQERNDSAYQNWRYKVYKRDNYKCKINNCDCKGRIEAHHILAWKDYPELRYEINNGITLCHYHHPRKKGEDIKLIQTLTGLVMQTN